MMDELENIDSNKVRQWMNPRDIVQSLGSTIVQLFQFQLPWVYPLSCYLSGENTSHCRYSHPSSSSFEFCLSSRCLLCLRKASKNSPDLFNIRISNIHPSSNFPLKGIGPFSIFPRFTNCSNCHNSSIIPIYWKKLGWPTSLGLCLV